MKKIYIEENAVEQSNDQELPLNINRLRSKLAEMSIMTEVEEKPNNCALVRVADGVGTGQYFASAGGDIAWLRSKSNKMERRGAYTFYYLKMND